MAYVPQISFTNGIQKGVGKCCLPGFERISFFKGILTFKIFLLALSADGILVLGLCI